MFKKVSISDQTFDWIVIVSCIGLFMIVFNWLHVKEVKTLKSTEIKVEKIYDLNDPYTEQKVKEYLKQLKVKYPDVAIAQMKLESANGTSKIFNENNNLFGMHLATVRPTTALGEKNGHAYYSHWRQSCIDYSLFMAYTMNEENSRSKEAWLRYIGKIYSEDDSYIKKLKRIIN